MTVRLRIIRIAGTPDHGVDAERVAQNSLGLVLLQAGITIFVQDVLFSDHQAAFAIDVDATPFHVDSRRKGTDTEIFSDAMTDRCILPPRCMLLAPGIEVKDGSAEITVSIDNEVGTVIAHPGVVELDG